jgi:hypothetical protein
VNDNDKRLLADILRTARALVSDCGCDVEMGEDGEVIFGPDATELERALDAFDLRASFQVPL